MIHFNELDREGVGEIVYSWECPDTGLVRLWATGRMETWLPTSGIELMTSLIDPERAKWFIENRGVETHRIQWLLNNPQAMENPLIMLRLERESSGEKWDLMLDGHHRYVAKALRKHSLFNFYHLTEEQAREFEVEGHPQPSNGLNVNSFSGLGLDR